MMFFKTRMLSTFLVVSITLLSQRSHVQTDNFLSLVFSGEVIGSILIPAGIEPAKTFRVINRTDLWRRERFYTGGGAMAGIDSAWIDIYAYNDSIARALITPLEWSHLAHIALAQYSRRIKTGDGNVSALPFTEISKLPGLYFSVTKPAIYRTTALLDLTYYYIPESTTDKFRGLKGKALFILKKGRNNDGWMVQRVVNNIVSF